MAFSATDHAAMLEPAGLECAPTPVPQLTCLAAVLALEAGLVRGGGCCCRLVLPFTKSHQSQMLTITAPPEAIGRLAGTVMFIELKHGYPRLSGSHFTNFCRVSEVV